MAGRGLLLLFLTIASLPTSAGTLAVDRQRAIDAFVQQFVDFAMFDGNIIVDIGGDVVYERSFGYAQVEQQVPNNAATRFHLASVSKTITDAAVARMLQGGVFALDAAIAPYLPGFPRADEITIEHLVKHTSGIPHTNRQPWGDGTQSLTIDEIVERLAELPLDFEPGTDEAYSNGGYAVLAKILELAGEGTLSEVLHATVFEPLGMNDSGHVTDVRTPVPKKATGYEPGLHPGERRHTRYYAIESRPGGGSLYSTTGDMLTFMRAVFRQDFVNAKLRGIVMGEDDSGYLSQGRSPGFVAKALYRPEDDVIVVSLSNSYAVPSDWAAAIADLATGKVEINPWPELKPDGRPIGTDDPRLGSYQSSYSDVPTVVSRDDAGNLVMGGTHDARNALIPLVGGDFLQPIYYQLCQQDKNTRIFTCTMLSGEERYTSTHTPLHD